MLFLLQAQPKHAVKPAVIIAHMNMMILRYLTMHLPLSEEQRGRIQISSEIEPELRDQKMEKDEAANTLNQQNGRNTDRLGSESQNGLSSANKTESWEILPSANESPSNETVPNRKGEVRLGQNTHSDRDEKEGREEETSGAAALGAA